MTLVVTHSKVSAKVDGADASLVQPSDWNANHVLAGGHLGRGYIAGLGLTNNSGDTTNDIDIAVGECRDSTNADDMILASGLTKRLDSTWAVGTNQGMLASGAALTNTTYHIFVIKRPDTGVVDIAADTSASGANIAANTDVAYTLKRRIGSIVRAGGAIKTFVQDGDYFQWKAAALDISAANPGTSAVTRTLTVPVGIRVKAWGMVGLSQTANTQSGLSAYISDLDVDDESPTDRGQTIVYTLSGTAAGLQNESHFLTRTNTSAQVRSRCSASDAATTLKITTLGFWDRRGKDD